MTFSIWCFPSSEANTCRLIISFSFTGITEVLGVLTGQPAQGRGTRTHIHIPCRVSALPALRAPRPISAHRAPFPRPPSRSTSPWRGPCPHDSVDPVACVGVSARPCSRVCSEARAGSGGPQTNPWAEFLGLAQSQTHRLVWAFCRDGTDATSSRVIPQ